MAYNESLFQKSIKLVKHPVTYIPKIHPYLKSRIEPYRRDIMEFFGNKSCSNPYPDSDKLYKYLCKDNGFFVQVGGNDGYGFDPTYQLEKFHDWTGIITEPLPIYKLCSRNRKRSTVVNIASVPFSYTDNTIEFIDCNFMSFPAGGRKNPESWITDGEKAQNITAKIITVPAQPPQKTIDLNNKNNKKIDLLVIDVEGYELPVLQGLDFQKNSPLFLLLEISEDERFQEINAFLAKHSYEFIDTLSECDKLFKFSENN